jgi:hypothetical protein
MDSGIANVLGLPLQAAHHASAEALKDDNTNRQNPEVAELYRDINSITKGRDPDFDALEAAQYIFKADLDHKLQSWRVRRGMQILGNSGLGLPTPCGLTQTISSVIMARTGGKPLLPEHLEALCEFCKFKIRPNLVKAVVNAANGDIVPGREAILKQITKGKFLEYFQEYTARKVGITGEARWWTIPSLWYGMMEVG